MPHNYQRMLWAIEYYDGRKWIFAECLTDKGEAHTKASGYATVPETERSKPATRPVRVGKFVREGCSAIKRRRFK
jgi:hypothetical protein